jgi:hypothetical protein
VAHYDAFGHSLIYVSKAAFLRERLGPQVAPPLVLSLVRQLIVATREDRIPEFRAYTEALGQWRLNSSRLEPHPDAWHQLGVNQALAATVAHSHARAEAIYTSLLLTNAENLLNFDIRRQDTVHVSVSGDVGWLDFTHGITFANAVRKLCAKFPDLWPQGLLQLSCFAGRNASFTDASAMAAGGRLINDTDIGLDELLELVLNHGQAEYIVSVHWLKVVLAAREALRQLDVDGANRLVSAVNRFIRSPLRRRQVKRTAYQAIEFVAKE